MNADERVRLIKIGITRIGVGLIPFVNVFGVTDRAYDIIDSDKSYLLNEDGKPMLYENKSNILLEQQKQKVWRKTERR